MAPLHGDTVLRALTISLFLSLFVIQTFGILVYTREELLVINSRCNELTNDSQSHSSATQEPTHQQCGRRRGKRGGALVRLRKQKSRMPLPSIFLGNIRSPCYKIDAFCRLINIRKDFRDSSLFCFTETWLDPTVPESAIEPPGFALFRSDQDFKAVDKGKRGDLCFYLNETWCTNTTILSHSCTPELETLVITCRPFYLPREFGSIVLCATYVLPEVENKITKTRTPVLYPLCSVISTTTIFGKGYLSTISTWIVLLNGQNPRSLLYYNQGRIPVIETCSSRRFRSSYDPPSPRL